MQFTLNLILVLNFSKHENSFLYLLQTRWLFRILVGSFVYSLGPCTSFHSPIPTKMPVLYTVSLLLLYRPKKIVNLQ